MNSNHANLGYATLIDQNLFVFVMLSICYFGMTLLLNEIKIRKKWSWSIKIFVKADVSMKHSPYKAIKTLVDNAN